MEDIPPPGTPLDHPGDTLTPVYVLFVGDPLSRVAGPGHAHGVQARAGLQKVHFWQGVLRGEGRSPRTSRKSQ